MSAQFCRPRCASAHRHPTKTVRTRILPTLDPLVTEALENCGISSNVHPVGDRKIRNMRLAPHRKYAVSRLTLNSRSAESRIMTRLDCSTPRHAVIPLVILQLFGYKNVINDPNNVSAKLNYTWLGGFLA